MKGGKKVIVEPHRFAGIFIARGNDHALITKNMVPGEAVYGEKRITVEVRRAAASEQCGRGLDAGVAFAQCTARGEHGCNLSGMATGGMATGRMPFRALSSLSARAPPPLRCPFPPLHTRLLSLVPEPAAPTPIHHRRVT